MFTLYIDNSVCMLQSNGEETAMDYGASCTTHIHGALPGRSRLWQQDGESNW